MDQDQIDAMRKVIDMNEWSIKHYEDRGADRIDTKFGDLPIETLRVANRGFRALVDEAAERVEQPGFPYPSRSMTNYVVQALELASGSAARNDDHVRIAGGKVSSILRPEDAKVAAREIRALMEVDEASGRVESGAVDEAALRRITRVMADAVIGAGDHGDPTVSVVTSGFSRVLYAVDVRDAVRAIEAILAAKPDEPAKPAEPTLEECVAAMNRANHRGWNDWEARIVTKFGSHWLNLDELEALGRLLIARERADAARGGA